MKTPVTSVCCVCGSHLRGPWPACGEVSHGLCQPHFQQALREVAESLIQRERQQQEPIRAAAA